MELSENNMLGRAVFELPVKYREVIIFYYYKELKIEEIAALLSVSDNTIKTRLRRAREKLKIKLEGSDLDEGQSIEKGYR